MNDCLILDAAPGKSCNPAKPIMFASLAALADLQFPHQWRASFDRMTLLDKHPGDKPFPMRRARERASELRPTFEKYRYVVILGKRAAKAIHPDLVERKWFAWGTLPCDDAEAARRLEQLRIGQVVAEELRWGTNCAVVPHPARCSRWWQDPKNCAEARRWWSILAREVLGDVGR